MIEQIGILVHSRLSSFSDFTSIAGTKIFPVKVKEFATYPCATYQIIGVDNFITKSNSLNTSNLTLGINCYAENYAATSSLAKAVIEALDYYQTQYSEVGVGGNTYTIKFHFDNLSDEFYDTPEVYYKEIIFNCLIIKN
jgi:hypothetical protein